MQLVVTIGPASFGMGRQLAEAGATAFRLNASHMSASELAAAIATLRLDAPSVPLIVDLQGAKMRLGRFAPRSIQAGERVQLELDGRRGGVPLPHSELFASVHPGETLSLDDDRLRLQITEVGPERLVAVALCDAVLQPRKGVNVVEHPVELSDLTSDDQARLSAIAAGPGVAVAFSFMKTGAEAAWVRRRLPGAEVIGKIERHEACQALDRIAAAVDALWICRGDLGAQLGSAGLARQVAGIQPRALPVPVLMAGQVLQSLVRDRCASRSEVCHLYDLLSRGYAGVVLSDETAVGGDPVNATVVAAQLIRELD